MRLLCIDGAGLLQRSSLLENIRRALTERITDSSVVCATGIFLNVIDTASLWFFANRILEENDTGGDIGILGYSLGGRLADIIAPYFIKSRVLIMGTVFTPNKYLPLLLPPIRLSKPSNPRTIPIISFEAEEDPWLDEQHPRTLQHTVFSCNHDGGDTEAARALIADKIAESTKNWLLNNPAKD